MNIFIQFLWIIPLLILCGVYIIEIAFLLLSPLAGPLLKFDFSLLIGPAAHHVSRLDLLVPSLELMKLQPVSCSVAARRCYPWSIWNIDSTSILRKRETRWKKMSALKTVQLFNGGWRLFQSQLKMPAVFVCCCSVNSFGSFLCCFASTELTRTMIHFHRTQMALISVAKVMSFQLVTKCMSLFRFINQPGGLCLIVCQLMGYDILIQSQTPTRHVNDSSSSNSAPVEPRLMRVAWMTSSLFQLKGVRWSKEQIRIFRAFHCLTFIQLFIFFTYLPFSGCVLKVHCLMCTSDIRSSKSIPFGIM